MLSPETIVSTATPPEGNACMPYGMVGSGAKAYLPFTEVLSKLGILVDVTMICIATLPFPNACVALEAFHDIELGSTMWYVIAQSNQNWTAWTTSGEFN